MVNNDDDERESSENEEEKRKSRSERETSLGFFERKMTDLLLQGKKKKEISFFCERTAKRKREMNSNA